MDELIAHVSEKTYAYGAIRAENQNLLIIISELKTTLETVKKAKKVGVYVWKNKQTENTSANVASNNENVIDVDVANASKAKTLLYISCTQNVVIPCHDKCLANYKSNVHSNVRRALSTNTRTPKPSDTTSVVLKTRFFEKLTQCSSDRSVDCCSGYSKHMTGDRSLLRNFIERFMSIVRFGNDNFAAITGYADYIQSNITICLVYYVDKGDDLLIGERESNLYTISISDMAASSPICLMSKATSTKSWLWHRRLSHLNFSTINDLTRLYLVDGLPKFKYRKDHLCSAYERGKSKKASHPPKLVPKIIKKFIAQAQLNYKAKVCKIHTDNGTKFKNATPKAHYEKLGTMQQFSTARTPQQNGVVERRNRTLVEAARTMLIFSRLPEFLWVEAVANQFFIYK
ncbi:retrovirus-related pol polyprotein from transposon TNT 1-94 [Tanacetum coccineum]|uniref:Retrovirus-related pol polyprotein from transposon TNT 1-94 n=1 Tax=Tanacetum coccineum TaxID=301880 RepID=A0ABQ5J268_9ASTR